MNQFFSRVTFKPVKIEENWKVLKNFQTVRPLTVEQQIQRFTTAGKELDKLRGLGVYDFNENQPLDDEIDDITREPDFDAIDAAVAMRDAQLRMQSQAADKAAGTETQSPGQKESPETENSTKTTQTDASRPVTDQSPSE